MAHIEQKAGKFIARIHRRGFPTRSKTFSSKRLAEAWARELESQMDKGITPARVKKSTTIGDIFDEYFEAVTPDWREVGRYRQVQEDLKAYTLETLTKQRVKKYLQVLKETPVPDRRKPENRTSSTANRHKLYDGATVKTYSDSTIRKYFYSLKTVLQWHADHHNYPFDSSRFSGVEVPRPWSNVRERRLSPDGKELKALLDACTLMPSKAKAWENLILFAIETAMRAQELMLAKWTDVTPDKRALYVKPENEKTKKGRTVLLSKAARELLAKQRHNESYLFEEFKNNSREMIKSFRLLCHKAGIDDFKFHDLRHEAISRLCENSHKHKLSMLEVMEMTGHSSLQTFKRYTRFFNTRKADFL